MTKDEWINKERRAMASAAAARSVNEQISPLLEQERILGEGLSDEDRPRYVSPELLEKARLLNGEAQLDELSAGREYQAEGASHLAHAKDSDLEQLALEVRPTDKSNNKRYEAHSIAYDIITALKNENSEDPREAQEAQKLLSNVSERYVGRETSRVRERVRKRVMENRLLDKYLKEDDIKPLADAQGNAAANRRFAELKHELGDDRNEIAKKYLASLTKEFGETFSESTRTKDIASYTKSSIERISKEGDEGLKEARRYSLRALT
jgi:hypothetical protein